MPEISFLTAPTLEQKQQMITLYHFEKWWPKEKNNPEWITKILKGSHCIVIATNNAEVIGMGRAISDGSGDAYLHDITVKKQYRHQGIASRIIDKLIQRLTDDGITWIGLIAEQNSFPLYENFDFRVMDNASPMVRYKQKT